MLKKLEALRIGYGLGSEHFSKKRPTLVMIHGAGGRSQVWQAEIHLLKDCLNILALDLPGHGETDGPSENSVAEYAQWVSEILVSLFPGPVFLMGHSMGGAIVQETALFHLELLKGIILVSTGPKLQVAPQFLEGLLTKFEETVDSIIGYAYAPDADPVLVKEGAKLMKAAGCHLITIGFESANQKILNNLHKGITVEQIKEFVRSSKKARLLVHGCFIAGNPGETKTTLKENLELAKKLNCDSMQFYPLIVYPGTEAYNWAKENNYLFPR